MGVALPAFKQSSNLFSALVGFFLHLRSNDFSVFPMKGNEKNQGSLVDCLGYMSGMTNLHFRYMKVLVKYSANTKTTGTPEIHSYGSSRDFLLKFYGRG